MDKLLAASVEDIMRGYEELEDAFACLFCEKKIEKGLIYQVNGQLYEAWKSMEHHVEKSHGSVFSSLLQLDKEDNGLTELQGSLLQLFQAGKSDKEIQAQLEIGSTSTIRNHRATLRKKERQAKVLLALLTLAKEVRPALPSMEKYYNKDGRLKMFTMKQKDKLVILENITNELDANKSYTEKELNQRLKNIYEDYPAIRRALIEFGFLDRKQDGSLCWVRKR